MATFNEQILIKMAFLQTYLVGAGVGVASSIKPDPTIGTAGAQGWRRKWRRLETNESWGRIKGVWQIDLWERTEEKR